MATSSSGVIVLVAIVLSSSCEKRVGRGMRTSTCSAASERLIIERPRKGIERPFYTYALHAGSAGVSASLLRMAQQPTACRSQTGHSSRFRFFLRDGACRERVARNQKRLLAQPFPTKFSAQDPRFNPLLTPRGAARKFTFRCCVQGSVGNGRLFATKRRPLKG